MMPSQSARATTEDLASAWKRRRSPESSRADSARIFSASMELKSSRSTALPIARARSTSDSAALWLTTVWRFESNGWPRERLFALDAAYPRARDDDAKPQEGRTGSAEHMAQLAAEVERVRRLTGAPKVALVGNSRGGNAIR